jgi:3-oxoacyl-[acyl-carrier protein] reductase
VTRWAEVQEAVDTARRIFGRLDVVVNCAGILRGSRLEETSEKDWNEVLRVNLTGAFLVTKAAMKAMRELTLPPEIGPVVK